MTAFTLAYALSLGNHGPASPHRSARRPLRAILRSLILTVLALVALLALAGSAGCTSLQNQVEAPRDNAKLSEDVGEQIFADGIAPANRVRVNSSAGVVTLAGQADTDVQAAHIAASAASVNGVMRVENRLRVSQLTSDGAKDRRTLIEDVRQALETSLPVQGPRLLVEADDGVVYLTGIVPDKQTKSAAIAVASHVEGVRGVEDNMVAEE